MRPHALLAFVLVASFSCCLSQSSGQVRCYLNTIDFSRFPLVDLYASVVDSAGEPVLLRTADTSICQTLLNRARVTIQEIRSVVDLKKKGDLELFLSMIFDNSASMSWRTDLLRDAAGQFIDSLEAGDYVNIIDFGNEDLSNNVIRYLSLGFSAPTKSMITIPEYPKPVHARQKIDFSNSKVFLRKYLPIEDLTSFTYLYDAILVGLSRLNDVSVLERKAIIVFSDGLDNRSEADDDIVSDYAREYQIPIYSIDLNSAHNDALRELAEQTGGQYFHVTEPKDVAPLYQSIYKLLKSQYRFTFRSPQNLSNMRTGEVSLSLIGRIIGQADRTFSMDADEMGYVRLVYAEATGTESLHNFFKYLFTYPQSRHADDVRLKIGEYWQARGQYAKALAVYNLIARDSRGGVYNQALFETGNILMLEKKFDQAERVYTPLLNSPLSSPVRGKVLLNLAIGYTGQGNFVRALGLYDTLRGDYGGTELAADATVRSAGVLMEMGDLAGADARYTEVISSYPESKSAVYALMDQARLRAKQGKVSEAIKLYGAVTGARLVDPDIRDDALRRRAELGMSIGDFAGAIQDLQTVAAQSTSSLTVTTAKSLLVIALLSDGRIGDARATYHDLPTDAQQELYRKHPFLSVTINDTPCVTLVNGAYVAMSASMEATSPIQIVESRQMSEKFAIAGPAYRLNATAISSRVSIPVWSDWQVTADQSGVYCFANGDWVRVPASLDERVGEYTFLCERDGIYALHTKPPIVTRLYDINFDIDRAVIRRGDEVRLYKTIDHLKANPEVRLEIAGHTDSTGTEEHNLELSRQRAMIVKEFMVRNGINPGRLDARGYAGQYPIAPNTTEENRQKNRRTEFTVLYARDQQTGGTDMEPRFLVVLNTYADPKAAVDAKKFYQPRGYDVLLMTEEHSVGGMYKLILGPFPTLEVAQEARDRFVSEFVNTKPVIVTINK